MIISGLQKVTLLDYPGHIACTIFFGRCNLRCPFCHNMELVTNPEHFPTFSIEDILKFLKERKGRLNGVAITGGEPLLNKDIAELLKPIKELGFPIKLDTNGFFPDMIEKLIDEKLVDMFAMDIKAGWKKYLHIAGADGRGEPDWQLKLKKSISLLINKADDYEFRTTCVKGLHTVEDFYEIKDMINGAKKYFLQNYKAAPDMKELPFKPFSREELVGFLNIVKDSVENVSIRGVD
ncbi:MAG: anaerobic ribonucleoside-triphosphate reductase activating protein [Lachnospiraceae bacterium]|nr:anaerobic ribonucleoside-triphosphate reductase activating protein [Lachnospiraceae bacterium]